MLSVSKLVEGGFTLVFGQEGGCLQKGKTQVAFHKYRDIVGLPVTLESGERRGENTASSEYAVNPVEADASDISVDEEVPVGAYSGSMAGNEVHGFPEGLLGETEEAAAARAPRAPVVPSLVERVRHELTHLPFRSWCEACVRGRGRTRPHRQRDTAPEPQRKPVVELD